MRGLNDTLVCYGANAVSGQGGQGEFLRHMIHALGTLPRARVLSRAGHQKGRPESIVVPFEGWSRLCSSAIMATPLLRRRADLLNLLSDVNFDRGMQAHVAGVGLFDGVMGQCADTFQLLRGRNIPVVLTALNMHIDTLSGELQKEHQRLGIQLPGFVHPKMQQRARREIGMARRIRVVSDAARASFLDRGVDAGRVEAIPPAIDLEIFCPTPQKDDCFRVLGVHTIDPRKGTYYLLQAFEKAAIPNSELVLIGGTGDRWSSQMLSQFRARLSNLRIQSANVMRDPVEDTYGQASVLVHPAIEDGFALAVGQALACGKPVITTRQTGAAQLIGEGRNGFVLECRDVDGMVDRLRLLAGDRERLSRMSAAAPDAVAHLGFQSLAVRVADFYCKALQN